MVLSTETWFSEIRLSFRNCLYFTTLHTNWHIYFFYCLMDGPELSAIKYKNKEFESAGTGTSILLQKSNHWSAYAGHSVSKCCSDFTCPIYTFCLLSVCLGGRQFQFLGCDLQAMTWSSRPTTGNLYVSQTRFHSKGILLSCIWVKFRSMAKQMSLFLFIQFLVSNHVWIVLGPEDAIQFCQHVFWVSVQRQSQLPP